MSDRAASPTLADDETRLLGLVADGLVLDAMDRHAEAIESYRAALASSPGYAEAWNNLGVVCSELGRRDEAR